MNDSSRGPSTSSLLETPTSRRRFLELASKLSVAFGLSTTLVGRMAEAAERVIEGRAPVIWLQGQACSGCSISLLNSEDPGPLELITQQISLKYHPTLSAVTGSAGIDIVESWAAGDEPFVLVVEGSLPETMPEACKVNGIPLLDVVERAARAATAVVAVGSCAAFGGIPAAAGNPTGAQAIPPLLRGRGVQAPIVRIPGCPSHPDWVVGTLVHLLEFGLPPLDGLGRPQAFFSRLVHDQCPRFSDFEREHFAEDYGEDGCLFRLGCLGVITHADCTVRMWNSGANSCINAGAPCIGCAGAGFALDPQLALSRVNEKDPGDDPRGDGSVGR